MGRMVLGREGAPSLPCISIGSLEVIGDVDNLVHSVIDSISDIIQPRPIAERKHPCF
jgi:hypothetical protein